MNSRRMVWAGFVFILAIGLRTGIILKTPGSDNHIDLTIYINGGQLVAAGINPYDWSSKPEERRMLRLDSIAYNPWICESQDRWDFYTSSNLPLSLLFYGAIESLARGKAIVYRLVFAFMDSILSVVVFLFVARYWSMPGTVAKWGIAILLAACSPVLLLWGAIIPEDKGVQITLMVAALYSSLSSNNAVRRYISPALLGASISFKGLGVFIAPLCAYLALGRPVTLTKEVAIGSCKYLGIALFTVLGIMAPYFPEISTMMRQRLATNISESLPIHASMWRYFSLASPEIWKFIKLLFNVVFLAAIGWGARSRRIGFELVTVLVLLWFVVVNLLAGSLDRYNIALLVSILLMGVHFAEEAVFLARYYIVGGGVLLAYNVQNWLPFNILPWMTFVDSEYPESLFVLGFMLVLCYLIGRLLFRQFPGNRPDCRCGST